MMHLVADIVKHFNFDDVNIDNWTFKLFYKGSFILFLMGSMVGILSQYFGEPINCDFKGIDSEMAGDYCWIHGSSYIPPEYQHHMKCIVDLDGIESADDAPDTSYYQWVTFVMMVQAGTFMLPYKIWSALEGGLMEEFGTEAKTKIILDEEYGEEAVVMDGVVDKYVKYFRSIWHRNNWYFFMFVLCEMLNCSVLFFNFWITNVFLNGKFLYYGWDVIKFGQLSLEEQAVSINPFCQTFPLEVSCTVPNVGAAGGEQNHNGLCVLSQNVINEKMYLAVWFWMVFLVFVIPVFLVYRTATLCFPCARAGLLMSKIGNTNDVAARKACSYVVSKCFVGDWFVLYQISKNCNMYFFRCFIKELKRDMKKNPKNSKSKNQDFAKMNHIAAKMSPSEIDEHEDKFEDMEEGETDLMRVNLPGETSSLLLDEEDAHNAPTLKRQSSRRSASISESADDAGAASRAAVKKMPLRGMGRGRMGRLGGKMAGKMGRGGGRKAGGRKGGKGGGMGGMDAEMDMAMMMTF